MRDQALSRECSLGRFNVARSDRLVARFIDRLFGSIGKLQEPGFDAKWKTINLGATVPGLARIQAAQEWLDRQARKPPAKQ